MPNPQPGQEQRMEPCPFCKHADELQVSRIGAADERWWEVFCDHCCTHGPTAQTETGAIAAWNTRPAADPGGDGELVARLRKRHTLVPGCPDDPLALLINPDGPEAADRLGTQAADIARLREGLSLARKALDRNYIFNINLEDVLAIIDALLSPNPTSP